ncbi:MAG: DUF4159 domain-containing protein [Melioribacteraceae bacterium]|nr:DUF4159 domain-containing protein [Melioribacteraceae bacterium]
MNILKNILFILLITAATGICQSKSGFQIARVKYSGGGDWYNDPSAEVNLLKYVNDNTSIKVNPKYVYVDISSSKIFSYPFLFITGHGNIVLSNSDVKNLREYLLNGGFLYVDDDYSLDKAFRREIKKVFPDKELVELPFSHGIYHSVYNFNSLPPKTHEHDNKPPQGFGIFVDKRLVLYYTYESNPSDGWADPDVHNDPKEKREEALKFGTNIIVWALSN